MLSLLEQIAVTSNHQKTVKYAGGCMLRATNASAQSIITFCAEHLADPILADENVARALILVELFLRLVIDLSTAQTDSIRRNIESAKSFLTLPFEDTNKLPEKDKLDLLTTFEEPILTCKQMSLRLVVSDLLRSHRDTTTKSQDEARSAMESERDQLRPLLRIIWSTLNAEGAFLGQIEILPHFKTEMSLSCAKAAIRIAQLKIADDLVPQHYVTLLLPVLQNPQWLVRERFVQTLCNSARKKVPARYIALLFIVGFDPDRQIVNDARVTLHQLCNEMRQKHLQNPNRPSPECLIPYLLHILAFHPDLTGSEMLQPFQAVLKFVIDVLGTQENVDFLQWLAEQCKTMGVSSQQGSLGPEKVSALNNNLWMLADAFKEQLARYAQQHNLSIGIFVTTEPYDHLWRQFSPLAPDAQKFVSSFISLC